MHTVKKYINVFLHSVCRLLATANVPSSPILVTLIIEALSSSEMSVLTKATWHIWMNSEPLSIFCILIVHYLVFLNLSATISLMFNYYTCTLCDKERNPFCHGENERLCDHCLKSVTCELSNSVIS
jgi:hypothetical protein